MSRIAEAFRCDGWVRLPHSEALLQWVEAARPEARRLADDPALKAAWLRHGGTWFAGVNVLENGPDGAIPGGPPLPEALLGQIAELGLPTGMDKGQISVVYPGYPLQDLGESDAAHRYRRDRDAAHIDGLLPVGEARRRYLREPHAYVLGIPLTPCPDGASPLVVWQNSHREVRKNFTAELGDAGTIDWQSTDLTDIYHATRRKIFTECPRVEVTAQPGEAYLLHRLTLHGVAPWRDGVTIGPEGRMIAYFRPDLPDIKTWLGLD